MYRIGVDLGGTNIAAGMVNDDGKIIAQKSLPANSQRGPQAVLADIVQLCKNLMDETATSARHVGIGCPGTVNSKEGVILTAPNIGFHDIPISQEVSKLLNIPVYIDNDANCAALGEAKFGAAKGYETSVTITLGTGVGGGIIIDGKIYTGPFFGAGEVGHQIIRAGGAMCGCGKPGCWEAYASATALIRDASGLAIEGDITAKKVFDMADGGDVSAKNIIDAYIENLCIGLSNIVNLLQPEIIVIGGGISGRGQSLIDAIHNQIPDLVLGGNVVTKFGIASLGNDAGIIGAACLGE